MAGKIDARLSDLGLTLPPPSPAVANYVPFVQSGAMVYVSGQLPMEAGKLQYTGKVGGALSIDDAKKAARLCAINILSQVKQAAGGDLDRVRRCVKLGGFVNAVTGFKDHPQVINGASDLVAEVLGEAGRHARFAVGADSLPLDAAVEIDAIFELT
ncbi:MAG: RidA family protein [Alphaproteobacteria bacterium]|nr:RidA family protein [Alphaproteobacteria bacterium]